MIALFLMILNDNSTSPYFIGVCNSGNYYEGSFNQAYTLRSVTDGRLG
ncbi:MAG: hypothetical protein NTV50_00010 [Planctomycetota bacterium]|nr:hypothetical protein [Planctomycetota bacterium]